MSTADRVKDRPVNDARAVECSSSATGVLCADNLELMRELADGSCDLIYVDPPFDSGCVFNKRGSASRPRGSRHDSGPQEHLAFLRPRLAETHRLLSPRGLLYVHLDWRSVHYVKVMLDGLFGASCFLNEIIWHYHSGARPSNWFARKHDTILLYARCVGQQTFNRLRGGQYRTRDLRMSDDGRPYKSTRNGPLYFDPRGPAVSDVWDIPFLSTASKERTGYPTQKPEALLERIVRASSNEGDLVADFFCGSGTALVAAKRLKRRWLGCDINPDAVAITENRLDRVRESDTKV